MTITTKYRNDKYAPDGNRYVRALDSGDCFAWCETSVVVGNGRARYDIAQGTCDAEDLPPDVLDAAVAAYGTQPGYVDWPLA